MKYLVTHTERGTAQQLCCRVKGKQDVIIKPGAAGDVEAASIDDIELLKIPVKGIDGDDVDATLDCADFNVTIAVSIVADKPLDAAAAGDTVPEPENQGAADPGDQGAAGKKKTGKAGKK